METMGDRIAAARDRRGLTRAALAKAVGISTQAVGQWERGDIKGIRPENMLRLLETLRVDLDHLVRGAPASRKLVAAAQLVDHVAEEYGPPPHSQEEADLLLAWRAWPENIRDHIRLLMTDTALRGHELLERAGVASRKDQERFNHHIEPRQAAARSKSRKPKPKKAER